MSLPYQRVLLKISGEALMGTGSFGIDPEMLNRVASEISSIHQMGVQVGVVVGGGNIFRGMTVAAKGGDRVTGDHMGMLATVMNCLALGNAIRDCGVSARVMSNLAMPSVCETFTQRRGLELLQDGHIVLFAGGSGNPYFTTDTAAALKAVEMNCDALFKGTQVDGVYSGDPRQNKDVIRYDHISHADVIAQNLQVMDTAAFALAGENNLPIVVFSLQEEGQLLKVVKGEGQFTRVG